MNISFTEIKGYADGESFRIIRNADDTVSLTGSLRIGSAAKNKLLARARVALVKLSKEPTPAQT